MSIANLGNYAHPPKGIKGRKPKHIAPNARTAFPPGANQKPNYPMVPRLTDPNIVGSNTVNDVSMTSAVPGSNSRAVGTIPPNGNFKTVQKQPPTAKRQLTNQRASAPPKIKKSGKAISGLPFIGM